MLNNFVYAEESMEETRGELENEFNCKNNEISKDIEEDNVKSKEDNKYKNVKGKIKICVILLVILLSIIGIITTFYYRNKQKIILEQQKIEQETLKDYNAYIENLNWLYSSLISGANISESVCVLTCNVWHDAIYENPSDETKKYISGVEDFDEALERVYSDEEIQKQLNEINESKEKCDKYIQNLQSCPEELNKAYDIALQANTAFSILADLALNPTGSYNTYSKEESEKVDAFIDAYTTLRAVIPTKKEVPLYDIKGNKINDEFAFDIYLNQMGDKLPETVDDSMASMGYYRDKVIICEREGKVSYNELGGVVSHISWETENSESSLEDEIINKLKEKYGEQNIKKKNSYSWNDDLTCNILVKVTDDKIQISWMSAF